MSECIGMREGCHGVDIVMAQACNIDVKLYYEMYNNFVSAQFNDWAKM